MMGNGDIVLLADLTNCRIPPADQACSWVCDKTWRPALELALVDANSMGGLADGAIGLLNGSVLTPCKVKRFTADLALCASSIMLSCYHAMA